MARYQWSSLLQIISMARFVWTSDARINLQVIHNHGEFNTRMVGVTHRDLKKYTKREKMLAKWFTRYEERIKELGGWNENGNPDYESAIYQFYKESKQL